MRRLIALVVLTCLLSSFGYPRNAQAAADTAGTGGTSGVALLLSIPVFVCAWYLIFTLPAQRKKQQTDVKALRRVTAKATEEQPSETSRMKEAADAGQSGSKERIRLDLATMSVRF
jgi:hypothetical protein